MKKNTSVGKSELPLDWAREKVQELLRKNVISSGWIGFDSLNGMVAMDTEAVDALQIAFDEKGYEMQQPGQAWIVRLKS